LRRAESSGDNGDLYARIGGDAAWQLLRSRYATYGEYGQSASWNFCGGFLEPGLQHAPLRAALPISEYKNPKASTSPMSC
jgi:hypothetical protein